MIDLPPDLHITVNDVRKAGYCVAGQKLWFKTHGLDFARFLRIGISAEDLIANGDHLAVQVVEKKLEREARG